MQIPTAKRFAMERGSAAKGPWSDFETVVFVSVINALHSLMIEDSPNNIHEAYNQVVAFSMSPLCTTIISTTVVLQQKSLNQIQRKYEQFCKELDLFNQLSVWFIFL